MKQTIDFAQVKLDVLFANWCHAAQPGDPKWRLQYARAAIAAGLPHYDNNGVTDMGPDGWWQWATQTS